MGVRDVPVFRGVSVVSRCLELAPFAVTSDGAILINVAKLSTATDFASAVRAAQEDNRPAFIGVMLSPEEAEFVMARLDNAAEETAARIAGQRGRRRRTRDRPTAEK